MKKLYIFLGIGAVGAVAYLKNKSAQAAAQNAPPLTSSSVSNTSPSYSAPKTTPTKMVTVSSTQPSVASQLAADQQALQDQKDQEGLTALGGISSETIGNPVQ